MRLAYDSPVAEWRVYPVRVCILSHEASILTGVQSREWARAFYHLCQRNKHPCLFDVKTIRAQVIVVLLYLFTPKNLDALDSRRAHAPACSRTGRSRSRRVCSGSSYFPFAAFISFDVSELNLERLDFQTRHTPHSTPPPPADHRNKGTLLDTRERNEYFNF